MNRKRRINPKEEEKKVLCFLFGVLLVWVGLSALGTVVEQAGNGLLGLFGIGSIAGGILLIILPRTKGKTSIFNKISLFKRGREWCGCSSLNKKTRR